MSNPIPSSLALTNIPTGSQILSSTHDSNYSAIQSAVNEFVTAFNSGVVNQVLLSAGGANVQWAYPPGFEIAYVEFTSTVNLVAGTNTEASPLDVVSAGSITFDGTPVEIEFGVGHAAVGGSSGAILGVSLWDGTDQGRLQIAINNAATAFGLPLYGRRRLTPSAGSHTFKVRGWCATANASINPGTGGVGAELPGFIRITKV